MDTRLWFAQSLYCEAIGFQDHCGAKKGKVTEQVKTIQSLEFLRKLSCLGCFFPLNKHSLDCCKPDNFDFLPYFLPEFSFFFAGAAFQKQLLCHLETLFPHCDLQILMKDYFLILIVNVHIRNSFYVLIKLTRKNLDDNQEISFFKILLEELAICLNTTESNMLFQGTMNVYGKV